MKLKLTSNPKWVLRRFKLQSFFKLFLIRRLQEKDIEKLFQFSFPFFFGTTNSKHGTDEKRRRISLDKPDKAQVLASNGPETPKD